MTQPLTIGLLIANRNLRQSLENHLLDCPAARVFGWEEQTANETAPDLLILEDECGRDTPLELAKLHQKYPGSALIVISSDKCPEHIVQVMKAGGSEFLITPVEKSQLLKAVADIRNRRSGSPDGGRGAIYTFVNSKGGVGSTVLSVNTALALQGSKGARVALWDMNFQAGDSVVLLDLFPKTTIIDICRGIKRLDAGMLKNAMVPHKSGLELLAGPTQPEEHDSISASHITRILSLIGNLYDQVVLDCPSQTVNHTTVEAFTASDKIFIVIDLSIPAVRDASRLFALIRQAGINEDKIEFVVNRFAEQGMLPIEEAERNLSKRIYWLFPNNFDEVISSINLGEPLVLSNPSSNLSKSIVTFVNKIKTPDQYKETRSVPKRHLLGGLFSR